MAASICAALYDVGRNRYRLVHDVFLDEDSPTSPKSDPCDEDSLASLASLGSLGLNNNPCTPPPPLPPPPPPPPLASATSDSNANSSASTNTSANASLVSVGGAAGAAALGLGRAARRRAPPAPTPPGDPQEQETGGDARAVAGRRAGRGPGALRLAAAARAVRHRRPDAAPARAQVPQLPARRRQLPGLGALPQHRRGLGQLHGALARRPQVLVAAAAAHRAVPVARVARIARVGGQQRRHALPAAGAAGGHAPRPAQVHPAPHRRDRGGDRRPHLRAEGGRRPLVRRGEPALRAAGHLPVGVRRGRGLQRLRPQHAQGEARALPAGLPGLRGDALPQGQLGAVPGRAQDRRRGRRHPGPAPARLHPRGVRPGPAHGRPPQARAQGRAVPRLLLLAEERVLLRLPPA